MRRAKTAREMAEQFGASSRTIQRLIAEPRENFEARAREKRQRAAELREQGLRYREIADELEVSIGSVSSLLHGSRSKATAR